MARGLKYLICTPGWLSRMSASSTPTASMASWWTSSDTVRDPDAAGIAFGCGYSPRGLRQARLNDDGILCRAGRRFAPRFRGCVPRNACGTVAALQLVVPRVVWRISMSSWLLDATIDSSSAISTRSSTRSRSCSRCSIAVSAMPASHWARRSSAVSASPGLTMTLVHGAELYRRHPTPRQRPGCVLKIQRSTSESGGQHDPAGTADYHPALTKTDACHHRMLKVLRQW